MLNDLQTLKLTRYFQVYDIDDDGAIDAADFERVVENVRILRGADDRSSAHESLRRAYTQLWDGLRSSADVDQSEGVDLDEWLAYWQLTLEDDARYEAEVAAITDRLFAMFDTDGDGRIGRAEFVDFHGIFGLKADVARTVFAELDANGDGALTREELKEISRQFFRSGDPAEPGNLLFGPYGA